MDAAHTVEALRERTAALTEEGAALLSDADEQVRDRTGRSRSGQLGIVSWLLRLHDVSKLCSQVSARARLPVVSACNSVPSKQCTLTVKRAFVLSLCSVPLPPSCAALLHDDAIADLIA